MSDEFVEGNRPDAYDFRGNKNPDSEAWKDTTAPEALEGAVVSPEPVEAQPSQVAVPASEAGGYHAPGGGVRVSIRDRIARVRPYVSELVEVPEWDSTIEIRSISLGERQAMMEDLMDENGEVELKLVEASYILRCAFDPDTNERVFADDDMEFVQNLPAGLADRIGHPAVRLSGMNEAVKDEAAKK